MRYVVVNFSKMLERNLSNRKIFCSVYLQRRYVPNLDYSTIISFRIHDFNFCTGDQCPLSLVVFFTRRKILISVVFLPCPVLNNDVSNLVNGIHYAINTYNTCSLDSLSLHFRSFRHTQRTVTIQNSINLVIHVTALIGQQISKMNGDSTKNKTICLTLHIMLISCKIQRSDDRTSSTVVYKQLVKGHILSIFMNKYTRRIILSLLIISKILGVKSLCIL